MPSPEHIERQSQEVFTRVDETSGDRIAQQEAQSFPQHNPLIEHIPFPESNASVSALTLNTHALLGIASVTQNHEQSSQQSESELDNVNRVRQTRRAIWEQTGYVPPITGGSPKRINLPTEAIVSDYRNKNLSTKELAQRYGVSISTIYKRLHEAGLLQDRPKIAIEASSSNSQIEAEEFYQIDTPEDRNLIWGEHLSRNAFWVFDYLHGIGYTNHLRELAQIEGIDFDAGLAELRKHGLLDEANLEYTKVKFPKPKLTPR